MSKYEGKNEDKIRLTEEEWERLGGRGDRVIEIPGRLIPERNEQSAQTKPERISLTDREIDALKAEYQRLEADNERLKQNYRDKENELEDLQQEYEYLEERYDKLKEDHETLKDRILNSLLKREEENNKEN